MQQGYSDESVSKLIDILQIAKINFKCVQCNQKNNEFMNSLINKIKKKTETDLNLKNCFFEQNKIYQMKSLTSPTITKNNLFSTINTPNLSKSQNNIFDIKTYSDNESSDNSIFPNKYMNDSNNTELHSQNKNNEYIKNQHLKNNQNLNFKTNFFLNLNSDKKFEHTPQKSKINFRTIINSNHNISIINDLSLKKTILSTLSSKTINQNNSIAKFTSYMNDEKVAKNNLANQYTNDSCLDSVKIYDKQDNSLKPPELNGSLNINEKELCTDEFLITPFKRKNSSNSKIFQSHKNSFFKFTNNSSIKKSNCSLKNHVKPRNLFSNYKHCDLQATNHSVTQGNLMVGAKRQFYEAMMDDFCSFENFHFDRLCEKKSK